MTPNQLMLAWLVHPLDSMLASWMYCVTEEDPINLFVVGVVLIGFTALFRVECKGMRALVREARQGLDPAAEDTARSFRRAA